MTFLTTHIEELLVDLLQQHLNTCQHQGSSNAAAHQTTAQHSNPLQLAGLQTSICYTRHLSNENNDEMNIDLMLVYRSQRNRCHMWCQHTCVELRRLSGANLKQPSRQSWHWTAASLQKITVILYIHLAQLGEWLFCFGFNLILFSR